MTQFPVLKPEAAAEAEEAYFWYEGRNPGLGMDFLLSLDACLSRIQRHPQSATPVFGTMRRALLKRFPYGVFYLHDDPQVTVYSVFHASRDPKILTDRFK